MYIHVLQLICVCVCVGCAGFRLKGILSQEYCREKAIDKLITAVSSYQETLSECNVDV